MLVLDPGNLDEKLVIELVQSSSKKFYLITQLTYSRLRYKELGADCACFEDIESGDYSNVSEVNCKIDWLYQEILGDVNTGHILDRRFLPRSFLDNTHYVLNLIDTYSRFIVSYNVESYILASAPHSIQHWVFARCFELLRNKHVDYFNLSLLPWRVSHIQGVVEKKLVELEKKFQSSLDLALWERYCELKNSYRQDIMPAYERNNRQKSGLARLVNLFKINRKRPDIVINALRCKSIYKKNILKVLPNKYIIMFLHYQPERTTAPDGRHYANQLLAALLIKKALPSDVELIIKEHPSVFNRGSDLKHRWPRFYQDYIDIGASFVSVEHDTYNLVDGSVCVASVGGTIVAEAMLRNKPVVYFGLGAIYPIQTKSIHLYAGVTQLSDFIKSCHLLDDKDFEFSKDSYKNFIDKYTVSAEIPANASFDELTTLKYRLPAIYKYLLYLVKAN